MKRKIYDVLKDENNRFYWRLYIAGILLISLISCIYQLKIIGILPFGMILFGSLFFFAGLHACMIDRKHGKIFLFSHGLTGYLIMMVTLLIIDFLNPKITDTNPLIIIIDLVLIVIFTILGFKHEMIFNSNDKYLIDKKALFRPLNYFTIAFFLTGIIPILIDLLA